MLENNLMRQFVCVYLLIIIYYKSAYNAFEFNCHLPEKCRPEEQRGWCFIMCDIDNDAFEFKLHEPTPLITKEKCDFRQMDMFKQDFIFRWSSSNQLDILEKRLNFSNVISYLSYFRIIPKVNFWNLKGFDVNFLDDSMLEFTDNSTTPLWTIIFVNCRLDFYYNRKKINSCQDFIDSNLTRIQSIFQVKASESPIDINIKGIENKQIVCPLVFSNSNIRYLILYELADTFYKKSILSFSNEIYTGLNSNISELGLFEISNINLDMKLLHPSVFNYTKLVYINSGSLNSIDGDIFKQLRYLLALKIQPIAFRKIIHKQGINWIKQINYDVNVNISSNRTYSSKWPKQILIAQSDLMTDYKKLIPNSRYFPDEDFCIYVDFPFNQLVVIIDIMNTDFYKNKITCTYLWLAQYFSYYISHYFKKNPNEYFMEILSMQIVLNSNSFKSMSKCKFEQRISLCNRSNYQIKAIWDQNDFALLNKKIQITFKILLYPIAFFGLVTNSIVVLVILKKDNSDLFKKLKQYSYLNLNSIFCVMIMVIEILSWMTECFYPFEVFCPAIRKLVAIQFFKIIFDEFLVTVFRFMCNFTYIAFALNRISLIGKDHGKLVRFFSEIGLKKYIGVSLFISCLLSWIKYFKYEVNYFYPDQSFPTQIETNSNSFHDLYFIYNSISDMVNYLVFVIISAVIDICMVVQLRRTLEKKAARNSELLNQKQSQNKKAENEEAVNKAIKMVVLNSLIGICLKIPVCFIPLINLYEQFYAKSYGSGKRSTYYFELFSLLVETELHSLIQDMSNVLFILSLSIQMFIYKRFDKKFITGYQRLKDNAVLQIKKLFN